MTDETNHPGRDEAGARAAFLRFAQARQALVEADLSVANLDVRAAALVALGNVANIQQFREKLARLGDFDVRNVDDLADLSRAAWYAHANSERGLAPEEDPQLLAEGKRQRERLMAWAQALATEEVFKQETVDKIREGTSKEDLAGDLSKLANLFESEGGKALSLCPVTKADLTRAHHLSDRLLNEISAREDAKAGASVWDLELRRAWTLLDRAYGECRFGIQYLRRWENDADSFAPPLRRGHGPRKATQDSPGKNVVKAPEGEPGQAPAPEAAPAPRLPMESATIGGVIGPKTGPFLPK